MSREIPRNSILSSAAASGAAFLYLFIMCVDVAYAQSSCSGTGVSGTGTATSLTCTNSTSIAVPASGGTGAQNPSAPANPYPSSITVAGMSGTTTHMTVTFTNMTHVSPSDQDILLVGPNGAKMVIWSDVGGENGNVGGGPVTVVLDDNAAAASPLNTCLDANPCMFGGTFKPTAYNSGIVPNTDNFPTIYPNPPNAKIPTADEAQPYGTATFAGKFSTNPNGTWSLYIVDDRLANVGTIGGWSISFTTAVAVSSTSTALVSSLNPSFTGDSVTFTATVTSGGSPVTVGTVTFKDRTTTVLSGATLDVNGRATFVTGALTQGNHPITAFYNGGTGFSASTSNTVTQVVNTHTTGVPPTFCNPGAITVPDPSDPNGGSSAGSPSSAYPWNIFVSGLTGSLSKVTLTLNGLTHVNPDDIDMLLVAPDTTKHLVLLSDVGGSIPIGGAGVNITLDDAAGSQLPDNGPLISGTFQPTAVNSVSAVTPDSFPSPAPALSSPADWAAPFGSATLASKFAGISPNGTWSLYVADDQAGNTGAITSACLTFTTSGDAPTTTTVTSSLNPSFTGDSVIFTAHVKKNSDNSNVTMGTVTFTEGTTVLQGPTAVNASGNATFTTSSLTEGDHTITASYNGVPGNFNISNSFIVQRVNNHTTISGTQYCNTGAISLPNQPALNSAGNAGPYPSNIFVTSLPGTTQKVTLSLNGLTHTFPDDIDMLLVSPLGTKLVVMSDAGGANPVSGINLTLDDSAASLLPDSTALVSGTFRPTAFNTGTPSDTFPAPAPALVSPTDWAAPFGTANLSLFNTVNGNGTWALYVVDDKLGDTGSFSGGWCLNFTENAPVLTISKSHVGNFRQGQTGATYTLHLTNAGPGPTGGTITVTENTPSGLTVTGMSGTNWSCASVSCTRSDVLAQGAPIDDITVTVDVANNAPASVTNTATVSGGGTASPVISNNDVTTVVQAADLTITNVHNGTFHQGDTGDTYTITVQNIGPGPTVGTVTVTINATTGLTVTGLSGTNWSCNAALLTCTRSDVLAISASYPAITMTVNVANNAATPLMSTAVVSGGGELNTANDSSTDSVTVVQIASIAATAGTPQAAMVGTAFAQNLAATVKDGSNVGVPGVNVTFTAPVTGATGTFAGNVSTVTVATNASGVATAPQFTANIYAGAYMVTAAIAGHSASFSLTNTATGGPPTAVSVTGITPGSLTQTLTLNAASPNGASYLQYVAVTLSAPLLGSHQCSVLFDRETNGFYLWSDGVTGMQGPAAPGANVTYSNSECTFNAVGTAVSMMGNTLTVSGVNIVLQASYGSSQNVYMYANDNANQNSGWVLMGTTAPSPNSPPTSDTVTGGVVASLSQTLTFKYSSLNGYLWLNDVYAAMGPLLSASNSCVVYYDRPSGAFYLLNNAGTAASAPLTPGSAGTVQNSQCTLAGTGSTVSGSGNTLTMVLSLTFSASFGGGQNIFMYAYDRNGLASGWQARGSTVSSAPPTADSFSGFVPNTDNQTLTFRYSSVNGGNYIEDTYVLMNGGFSATNGCIVLWNRPGNAFYLMNDAGTAFMGPLTAANLSNTQCTLKFTGTQTTMSGTALNMTLNLTFIQAAFTGTKQVWMYAYDAAGNASGWVNTGTFTLP